MSPVTIPRSERRIQRSTSDDVMYDVIPAHVGDEPLLHENFRTPLASTHHKLREISSWRENWDGRGAAKPKLASILNAFRWIAGMRLHATQTRNPWVEPHVVADRNGDIVFEWHLGERTLSVYVSPRTVEYLKVSGPDMYADMQDGDVTAPRDDKDLWRWLMGQE